MKLHILNKLYTDNREKIWIDQKFRALFIIIN